LQEEKESIEQCLAVCAMASEHVREFENKVIAERGRLQKEVESTKQCFAICINTLEYIGQLQSHLSEEFPCDMRISSEQATANALQECKDILTNVTADLEGHIQEIKCGLQALLGRDAEMAGESTEIRTV
jgi:hypothetical protein